MSICRRAILSVPLLVGVCLTGCPTRTIYYDAGGDAAAAGGTSGVTGGNAGRTAGSAGGAGLNAAGAGAGSSGTGGVGAAGGQSGATGGGAIGAGGSVGSGGIASTGGSGGNVGRANTGGAIGSGGRAGNGGVGTGGITGSGGVIGSGGTVATGGRGSGGANGGGGHGGMAGAASSGAAGAAGAPPKALGESCNSGTDCGSGHCSAGLCCDQACQGTCQQCSATGHCQMPADDPACGTIACPSDTTCRDYATAIATNRCKQLGQCKTASDCSFVAAPTTRACGFYNNNSDYIQFCDASGDCVNHTINCGGDGPCAVGDNVCCAVGPGFSCISAAAGCTRQSGGAPPTGPYNCSKGAECSDGSVCCASESPGGVSTHCSQNCSPSYMVQVLQICNPAATQSECASGTCQPAPSNWVLPPGFYACQ